MRKLFEIESNQDKTLKCFRIWSSGVHSQCLGTPTVQWTWGVQGKADVGEAPCTPSSQERKQTSSSFPCTGRGGVWRLEAASKNSAVSILFYGSQYFDIVVSQYKWQAMQNMVTCVTWPRSKADLTFLCEWAKGGHAFPAAHCCLSLPLYVVIRY